ncbi:MAG TPA: peptide deformylase [Candidatus Omnitrophota bacterium]|nr:peptide deformylase [Candidatus Omnitrophota bacterium]HRY85301.1 peptide deformylase [Candidatus Omnitrophota bacterium]
MPKLKIRTYPDPILKKKAAPVTDFGPAAQKLFDDMVETMHVSDGVGLAAPQIGISQQIFIACPTMKFGEEFVMINPVIEEKSGAAAGLEGCLSVPGISAEIIRYTKLTLSFQDRHGKKHNGSFEGFFARVIQHEIDHLNGLLLIDHFSGKKREELLAQYAKVKNPPKL